MSAATQVPETVSVVVATRDRPEMLRRALDAIGDSDYAGTVETMVVFDQSEPDLTLATDDERRPVRVLRNSQSTGLAGARNSGALAATGRWLAFCDDDDEWFPTKLRHQVDLLQANPDAHLATCGISLRYQDEDFVRVPVQDRLTFESFLDDRMTEVHPSSFVMDRDWFVNDLGMVDEELRGLRRTPSRRSVDPDRFKSRAAGSDLLAPVHVLSRAVDDDRRCARLPGRQAS
jgi:glycosyltransferase involved in cell wall biosynthesis